MKRTKQVLDSIDSTQIVKRFGRDPISYFFVWSFIIISAVDYAFYDNLYKRFGPYYFIFAIFGFLISLVTLLPRYQKRKFLDTTEWPILMSFNLLVNLTFMFIYPIKNPYIIFHALLLYILVYWKGRNGYIVGLITQAIALIAAMAINDIPLDNINNYYFTGTVFVTSMAFGGVCLRLNSFDKNVRDEYVLQSRRMNVERERLKSLINSVGESVIATNKKGIILLHNGIAHDFANTEKSLIQKHIGDVIDLKDKSGNKIDIISSVKSATGILMRDDLHIDNGEDQETAIRMTSSPINATSVHRSDQGYIFLFADITHEKALDEQRDEFVNLLTHELRTPMAIIEGGISIATEDKNKPLSKEQLKWLNRAHDSTVYVSSLINDMASLTKVERDRRLNATPIVTRPHILLERLCEDYQEEAEKREIKLVISDETTTEKVISSEIHIYEILQNFISNAVKYTQPNTEVTLEAKQSPIGMVFSVKDRGAGISKENQKQLFTKYFRSDDEATKNAKGTGLGLYLSFKLAKQLGGKIWVESTLGEGSTFYLEVPNMVQADNK